MEGPTNLDETDRRIVELLQQDARRTVRDIADAVHLSPAPVKRRIDRLEASGVILGYTVLLDENRIDAALEAFTELRIGGDADVDELVALFMGFPEVQEAYTTAGDPDILVRLRARDVQALQAVVKRMRRSGEVRATKTLMVLGHQSRARRRVSGPRDGE